MTKPDIHLLLLLIIMLGAACSSPTHDARHAGTFGDSSQAADSLSDPVKWHRERTCSLASEKSLYRKYRIASDNAAFFQSRQMPLELGRNLEILGNVMTQMEDTARAVSYYDRAAECFRKAGATEDLYKNEIHRSNGMDDSERALLFKRLLADSVVTHTPSLRALALKGAYLCTDSLPLLDSCITMLRRDPSLLPGDMTVLLAMKAQQSLAEGHPDDARSLIPLIRKEYAKRPPIAQHREFIHTALAQIYAASGMKDSSINELCKVIWWTDSAYREANLPYIYSHETRSMIELAEENARLERYTLILWWIISAMALISIAALVFLSVRRRLARAHREIEMLDSRIEALLQSQASQGVMIDPRFTSRLKHDYPALSEGQLRLAALIAAGVESGQLASMLNISPRSLYTGRYRLRSALGLSKADSLEDLLRSYTGNDG